MFQKIISSLDHLFKLTFENYSYEKKFQKEYLKDNFLQNKLAIAVGLSVYILYIPLSYFMVPDDIIPTLITIISLPVLFSILFLLYYNNDTFERHRPLMLFFYSLIISLPPLIVMYYTVPSHYNVYITNMAAPIVAIFVGLGISFSIALLTNTLMVTLIIFTLFYLQVPVLEFIHNLLLLNSVFLLSGIGAFTHERSKRIQYLKQFKERELIYETITDPLTSVKNRRYLDTYLPKTIHEAVQNKNDLSVLLIDIDYFKKYNDTYGHIMGDEVLRQVSASLKNHFETLDGDVFRYGGEEFLIVLENTGLEKALNLAQSLVQKIEALRIEHNSSDVSEHVTISVGVTVLQKDETEMTELIKTADEMLYKAKEEGRNRVVSSLKEL